MSPWHRSADVRRQGGWEKYFVLYVAGTVRQCLRDGIVNTDKYRLVQTYKSNFSFITACANNMYVRATIRRRTVEWLDTECASCAYALNDVDFGSTSYHRWRQIRARRSENILAACCTNYTYHTSIFWTCWHLYCWNGRNGNLVSFAQSTFLWQSSICFFFFRWNLPKLWLHYGKIAIKNIS